jgi:two-component system, cell cycle sensor histidine kinase and response regulator CckA
MSASPHPSRSQHQEPSPPPLILVVDDERAVCDLTGSMLELHGYSVLRASSGEEALELFDTYSDRITLLVIDIVMPRMSGPIVAQQLRVIRPQLPVLFVSGLVSQGNFQGVMGGWFLRKPYTQKLLVTKIQQLMASSS